MMRALLQDLRYALRQMRHAPGFSVSVIVVLALGIGANAAMFTVLEGTLFRPLAYRDSGKLVQLNAITARGEPTIPTLADVTVWRERTRTLEDSAYWNSGEAYVLAQNAEQKIVHVQASDNLLQTLGAKPALGRMFSKEEMVAGRSNVALLSDSVWANQFHRDAKILGQVIRIDDDDFYVIGVMPQGFAFPADGSRAQIWTPGTIGKNAFSRNFDANGYFVIARMKRGVDTGEVSTELSSIQNVLIPLYEPPYSTLMATNRLQAVSYRDSLNSGDRKTALLALLGAVAALWLIACANVACLMMARTTSRRRELAVRAALGAGRARLAQQTMVESLLLSLCGGVAGLGIAQATLRFFRHGLLTSVDETLNLSPDGRVLWALLVLSLITGVLFAIVPARLAAKTNIEATLRGDGVQSGTGRGQPRLQRMLVVGQLALTLMLVVGCGMLLRTVFALRHVPLGFRTEHVFVIDPKLPRYKYGQDKVDPNMTVYRPLLARLKELPGVGSAAITTIAPLENKFNMVLTLGISKGKPDLKAKLLKATMRATGPELQQVLGFRMARGRYFDARDTPGSQLVAVVNRAFAKQYEIGNGDVSNFKLDFSSPGRETPRTFKIVGVVDDVHQIGIAQSAMPEIDVNAAQMNPTDAFYQPTLQGYAEIALRSDRDAESLVPEINRVIREMNPDLADAEIRTMDQIVEDAMGSQILAAHLLEALGGLALVVALAGLYSLLAYLVTLRTRELGLRLALGAQREDILSLVLRGAGRLLIAGTVVGVGISLVAARLLHSFLFGVKEYDLVSLIGAPVLLLAVGTFAAWLPARRASRLEPMEALRTE
ncbi:putative permease [Granulicella aggregans]|uniref:Putative permease n=1 Tax=Granulicella aggregans TaxID=474949 RepID=A0A7W7ZBU0_9BACT|nr:ABC transporter permease [Granulicella aggregans]MBB5056878.1 putative permease [Granulicella aggregans]